MEARRTIAKESTNLAQLTNADLTMIDPDAHHTRQLSFLWNGIGAARKGWLTRSDVVNCLPLGKIEQALAAKRSGRAQRMTASA